MGAAISTPANANLNLAAEPEAGSHIMSLTGGIVEMPNRGAATGKRGTEQYAELQYRQGRFAFGRHIPRPSQGSRTKQAPRQVEPSPVPEPAPAPAAAPAEPRGPLRLRPVRGVAPAEAAYSLGEALPPNLPHVTLKWQQFDFPEPPPGQLYVRVGNDVLLITTVGRIVKSVVPPG
jgi:Ni/Co efflux regulator RcnB